MKRLIIVGSPRTSGRSAHLAEMLFEANIDERPGDELFLVPVSEVEIGPCIGCDGCREKSNVILKGDDGKEFAVQRHRCVFDDDMQALYDLIDDADQVTVVSPVYFSGAPAPLKCLLDRLQPYFWASNRGKAAAGKRPAELHVIGEGSDPHGYDALVSEVRSAFAVAGFRFERVCDWVGKIDEEGEITAEAEERILDPLGESEGAKTASSAPARGQSASPASASENAKNGSAASAGAASRSTAGNRKPASQRPKLDLHSPQRQSKKKRNGNGR